MKTSRGPYGVTTDKSNRHALRDYIKWMRPDNDYDLFFLFGRKSNEGRVKTLETIV